MRRLLVLPVLVFACTLEAQRMRAVRPSPSAIPDTPEPLACSMRSAVPQPCSDGGASYASLDVAEVEAIVRAAAASLNVETMTIAVVDRAGRPLALYRKPAADPTNDDLAVGVARTAAFFSHNMAPLSSRTVRFISGTHFPPGVTNSGSGALYGIENTNRGCDFNVVFNANQCIPRARRVTTNAPCTPFDTRGCGPGIVTAFDGGIPLYRILDLSRANRGEVANGQLLGAIGVVGVPGDPQRAEFAALTGAFAALSSAIVPVPQYPLPPPGNVFIDGIRLPFLGPDQRLTFNGDGLPTGVRRLRDTQPGSDNGTFVIKAAAGGCTPNGYLVGPNGGANLSASDVDAIVQRAIAQSKRTRAAIRLPMNSYARMVIAVADAEGTILALYRMSDATVFSIDVAVAKARNVVWFSSSNDLSLGNAAVSNRTIGFGSQPFFPPGIDSSVFNPGPGPWFASVYQRDLANPCSQGSQPANRNQNGVVFFAGSSPLYRNRTLIGGLGVSGDGIEQDDYVTVAAAGEFLPPQDLWADQQKVDGVRLPMFKFPRQPEGVTECGGKPCS